MPAYRTYLGCSRRVILLLISVVVLALSVIAIALGVSLRKGSRYVVTLLKKARSCWLYRGQDLPLPSNTESFQGDLTYYAPGLGACGITSTDQDSICAVSHMVFDAVANGSDPNANPLCGLKIRASRFNELAGAQRSVDLKVVDRCMVSSARQRWSDAENDEQVLDARSRTSM